MRPLQKEIVKKLLVQPTINPEAEFRKSVDLLKGYMKKNTFLKSFVLGISGGQDSTLAGYIAQTAVNELNEEKNGSDYKFVAVSLPYGVQADEDDRQLALKFIKPSQTVTVNIKEAVDASVKAVEVAVSEKLSNFLRGNVKARERMKVQYDLAGLYKGVVLGTDHAAEAITGFFTKHGDGAADILPLYRLNKRQGKEILKFVGAPERLYTKIPTADLEDDKPLLPDEVALGVSYDEIDDYLEGKEIRTEAAEIIEGWYTKTEHKRNEAINVYDTWWK
ncbi:ammonia-dependent NAD(+) synthetase [Peribacillus simplex]|uniref:NH(3)-dependent NAD(+) synthetase n=2 Tax=Peribacillus simplex TaxID=1478 RepID=A0A223EPF5_9BACI|nr:ammonia-dependent NAD(+) synthetase [Peribacillus simplex]ASS97137.1 NAD(+) synthase [Peribacillus simplex NBRC 15720 = DSM 1321]MEC1398513.1 ammonia-dependent NAD(+) synthetase [Peribacillus simplex]MED3912537.1 ammonia-dependent NAD(+) synthetase [Peribacillus simplex]TVX76037.1 ammonia-dependent NAD(+) synthetase [Peribacillus simplex]